MCDELEAELVRVVVDRRRRMQEPGRPDYRRFKYSTDLENTISICSKKLNKDPGHQRALYLRASAYLKKGLIQEAIKDCEKLIDLDKEFVGSYYIRGCAYERIGEIDKGISDYTKVLALDPNHVNAAYARGECQNRKGNFVKVIEDYSMALEKDCDRPSSPYRKEKKRGHSPSNFSGISTGTYEENLIICLYL